MSRCSGPAVEFEHWLALAQRIGNCAGGGVLE
jgi:hypothetical protein